MRGREGEVRQQMVLGALQQLGDLGEARAQTVGHAPQLGSCAGFVGLLEDRADGRGDHALRALHDQAQRVARGMHPTALPGAAQEGGLHRRHQARMRVADDQSHPAQATRVERAQEGQPTAALVATGGGDLDAEHAALAGGADADRDQGGHAHHQARLAHLVVEGVERDIRVARRVECRPAAEGVDLGVEPGADAAHLALGQVGHPQRADSSSTRRVDTPPT